MNTKIDKDFDTAFKLDKNKLENLCNLLRDRVGDIKLIAKCNDYAVREFESFEEIEKFDNTDDCKIIELTISSVSQSDTRLYAKINFESETKSKYSKFHSFSSSKIYVTGRDADVRVLCSDIENKINMLRPWYFRYSKIKGTYISTVFLISIFIIAYVGHVYVRQSYFGLPDSLEIDRTTTLHEYVQMFLNVMLFFFIFSVSYSILSPFLNSLCSWLFGLRIKYFPSGVILLGHQLTNESDLDKTRRAFLIWVKGSIATAVLALVVSVVD